MSMSKQEVQVSLKNAVSQGIISAQQSNEMVDDLDDIALGGCGGVDVDDIDSDEVTLVAVVIDESGSMSPHRDAVIQAYNEQFLRPIKGAKNAESILISCWTFSDLGGDLIRLLHGYTPAPDCPELGKKNYRPDGATPLFLAAHNSLSGMIAYAGTLQDSGTRTKCIVVVLSDGWENASPANITDLKMKDLSRKALAQENFVLSYIFFGPKSAGDQYAEAIGFPPHHRLTADLTDSEVRRVFGTVSASVITASQNTVSVNALSSNPFLLTP